MYEIPAKVYYKKSTGEVLVITPEMENTVKTLTKEEEMNTYQQLKNVNVTDIDYIEIPYGTLVTTFTNAKSYSVNLVTKKLDVIYYTQDELNAIEQQNQDVQDLNSRVSDITSYLSNSDETTISDIENSILEIEKNKIINGGM